MDPFPKPPQKYQENPSIVKDLEKGKCVVSRFHGQIHLYVPQTRVDAISKEVIEQLAEDIYTKSVLDQFEWMQNDYAHSLMLELPPQKNEGDDRVEQLINAINSYV